MVSWLFSELAENPVPSGPSFKTVVSNGNLTVFADRSRGWSMMIILRWGC
jgi:hypothetical protein